MPVKTVTTWTATFSDEQRLQSIDEIEIRALAGKTDGTLETYPIPGGSAVNVPPFKTTRVWLNEAAAKDWIKWLEENIPGDHHSTEIVL